MTEAFWFGATPDRWTAKASRDIFRQRTRRNEPTADMLSVTIASGVLPQSRYLKTSASKKDQSNVDRSKYKFVEQGDLVYNKMRAWQGAAGCSAYEGIVSPAYVVLRATADHDPRYYGYMLRTPLFAREAERWSYGITSDQWSLRPEHFKMIWFPAPTRDEQHLIVRYLDNAELKITRAIRAKQQMLALLEERAAAVSSELLFGSSATGVHWYGVLPAHWDALPARALFWERIERQRSDLPMLSVTIRLGVVPQHEYLADSVKRDQSNLDRSAYKVVHPGDIVYNKMRAWQGAAGLSRYHGIVSPAYIVQTPREAINAKYAALLMRTSRFAKEAERLSYGITSDMWSLRPQHFKQILFPVPPRSEQLQIVEQVAGRTASLEDALRSVEQEIALLREYRTRLISDVVTGKKDVRAEASGMKDVDPTELAAVLAGSAVGGNDDSEGDADAD